METETYSVGGGIPSARWRLAFGFAGALLVLSAILAGCGGSSSGPFAWLKAQATPAGWHVVQIRSGSELSYPPDWQTLSGDTGTATAARVGDGGTFLGYLNVTPRQGDETQAGWASFRTSHNAEEGDRHVKRLAAATGLHFTGGQGSCVKDSYSTFTGAHYVEVACLVKGPTASTVIVGAAPPNSSQWGAIERGISAFRV